MVQAITEHMRNTESMQFGLTALKKECERRRSKNIKRDATAFGSVSRFLCTGKQTALKDFNLTHLLFFGREYS
jgi:hypothetical protein